MAIAATLPTTKTSVKSLPLPQDWWRGQLNEKLEGQFFYPIKWSGSVVMMMTG